MNPNKTLAAIRITRNRIGLAVFSNERLRFARCLNLPAGSLTEAIKSFCGFMNWAVEQFKEPTLAIEQDGTSSQRIQLTDQLRAIAKERGLPLVILPFDVLLRAYSYPPLKSRSDLRSAATAIWPGIALMKRGEILDAAALGLYIQTENLLSRFD